MKKEETWVKKRHSFFIIILKIILYPFFKIKYRLKAQKFKIKKGEKYIVLSNHQMTLDPFIISASFNKLLYFVASDDLTKLKFASWWINYLVAIIPKAKSKSDFQTVKTMMQVLKENGSVCIFPEGNRTYTGELCFMPKAIVRFIKSSNVPVILYNICGGYGVDPRWGLKSRRGCVEGKIKRVLQVDEIKQLTDDELYDVIKKELNVEEVPTNKTFKSKIKAEKLERILYVCPECQSVSTLSSKGSKLYCKHCGLELDFNDNLTLTKDHQLYKYPYVKDWCKFQDEWVRNYEIKENTSIFKDELIDIYITVPNAKQKHLCRGTLELTDQEVIMHPLSDGNISLNKKDLRFKIYSLEGVAILGKNRFIFRIKDDTYVVRTNNKVRPDFNSAKYVFMIYHIIHKLKGGEDEFLGI